MEAYWNQEDGYFDGNWWQDETKLEKAYEYLKKETEIKKLTMLGLAERFEYGKTDNRMYALQAIIGTSRTGVYDSDTMITLKSVLSSQGIEDYDTNNPALTKKFAGN